MAERLDFFISYSHVDRDWVRTFFESLERHTYWDGKAQRKIKVFYDDRDIDPGSSVSNTLVEKIKSARFYLLIMSPECFDSEWASREYAIAQVNKKKIVPIYLRDHYVGEETKKRLTFGLIDIKYIDFRAGLDYETQVKEVVNLLHKSPATLSNQTQRISKMFSYFECHINMIKYAFSPAIYETIEDRYPETIDTVFNWVMDRIGWVVEDNGTIIGSAWAWRDDLLFCAKNVGRHIQSQLSSGREVKIKKADPDEYSNEVRQVADSPYSSLSSLRVWATCWMPYPIPLEFDFSLARGKRFVELGAITYQREMDSASLKPILSRFRLTAGGRLQQLGETNAIAPGTPLFDNSQRLVGILTKNQHLELKLSFFGR